MVEEKDKTGNVHRILKQLDGLESDDLQSFRIKLDFERQSSEICAPHVLNSSLADFLFRKRQRV